MKPILISLALLVALCSCSSTKRGQKAPATSVKTSAPATSSGGNAFPETVVLSPAQASTPAPAAVVVSSVHAAPQSANLAPVPQAAPSKVAPAAVKPTAQPGAPAPIMTAVEVQQIPFQVSTSSVSVEKLAAKQGCTGGKGASLATEKGPVEVYKMQCDNGKVFLAKCELRQCKAFSWQ